MAVNNYVKFQRGSFNAFKKLAHKDLDTLYFIYEEESNESSLYLGERLIASSADIGVTHLHELLDVVIEDAAEKQFLTFNGEKWVNKSFDEVIDDFVGTNGEVPGKAGLVPAPKFDDANKFLRADGTWAEVEIEIPEIPEGDNASIVLNDGAYMLKDFGVKYYKYVAAEGQSPAHYEEQVVDADHPWAAGLEPKVVLNDEGKLVLGWFEPNPTTSEGVNSQVAALQTSVGALSNSVAEVAGLVGAPASEGVAASGLFAEVDKKANAEDVYTSEEVDTKIGEAIAGIDHLSREIVEILPEVEDADPNVIYMVPSGLEEDDNKYYEYILTNGKLEKVGSWAVDLSAYAKTTVVNAELDKKVDKVEGQRLMTDAEGTKLAGIAEGADVSLIKEVDEANFKVEEGVLSLLDIPQSKVTDLTSTLNALNTAIAGKVDAQEGYSLMSDAQAAKLEGIEEGAQKNNITDVSEQLKLENGVLSIVSITSSQVTDLASVLNEALAVKADKSVVDALNTTVIQHGNDIDELMKAMTWVDLDAPEGV